MKKMFFLMAAFLMVAAMNVSAQSAKELAKQQKELNDINRKMLDAKPTKDAKKQAKALKKEGWMVSAGEKAIEKQLTESQLLGEELMADEDGNRVKRFIQHTGYATAGSYNTGYAQARAAAMNELASQLKTDIVSAWQMKMDNDQMSASKALTNDRFNERVKAIVDQSLTNVQALVKLYRRTKNDNYEVQVRIAFDIKELKARLKRNMQKDMEKDGDELNSIVDEIVRSKF